MILTEFQLRQRLLLFRSENQKNVDAHLRVWNEKIARGVPVPQYAWYDLFGSQVENSIQDVTIFSDAREGMSFFVSVGIAVNEENPFMTEFVYKIDGHKGKERFERTLSIGLEDYIVDWYKELINA